MIPWSAVYQEALTYAAFLDKYATPPQRERWDSSHAASALTPDQVELLGGFTRTLNLLVVAGTWCGDCVNQCPTFDRIAQATGTINLRFLDRDARPDVGDALAVNGGHRVPMLLALSEDFEEVLRYGERTLSSYRKLAEDQLGPACPTGFVPPDSELRARVTSEWLAEIERAHLIVRLSPKLRARHND